MANDIYDLTIGFDLIKDFFSISMFGFEWVLGLILIMVTMFLITRNPKSWGTLFLPLVALFDIMGLVFSPLIYVVGGFVFAISGFSSKELGNLLTASTKTFDQVDIKDMRIKSLEELELNRISKSLAKQNRAKLMNKELKKDLVIDTNIMSNAIAKTKGIRKLTKSEIDKLDSEKKTKKRIERNQRLKQISSESRAKGTAFQRAITQEKKKTQSTFSGVNESYISKGLEEITKKKRKDLKRKY